LGPGGQGESKLKKVVIKSLSNLAEQEVASAETTPAATEKFVYISLAFGS